MQAINIFKLMGLGVLALGGMTAAHCNGSHSDGYDFEAVNKLLTERVGAQTEIVIDSDAKKISKGEFLCAYQEATNLRDTVLSSRLSQERFAKSKVVISVSNDINKMKGIRIVGNLEEIRTNALILEQRKIDCFGSLEMPDKRKIFEEILNKQVEIDDVQRNIDTINAELVENEKHIDKLIGNLRKESAEIQERLEGYKAFYCVLRVSSTSQFGAGGYTRVEAEQRAFSRCIESNSKNATVCKIENLSCQSSDSEVVSSSSNQIEQESVSAASAE